MNEVLDRFLNGEETLVLASRSSGVETGRVVKACRDLNVSGNVILETSGTSGRNKWVILSRDSLRGSARAVNAHLEIRSEDIWICALPTFHTGGFSIYVRAIESDSEVVSCPMPWDPLKFVQQCDECRATLCSLVPTQLFDLVQLSQSAPSRLRVVLVGGAALDARLRNRAIAMGWPIHETYGMTEAGSQVATQRKGNPGMELLDCWDARLDDDSALEICGQNLFLGYLQQDAESWSFIRPTNAGGWFATGDRMMLSGRMLKFLGRGDSMIKVLGERVELDALQSRIESIAGNGAAIAAVPDARCGYKLVLGVEPGVNPSNALNRFNAISPGPERLSDVFSLKSIPRTSLGKILRRDLDAIIRAHIGGEA